MTYKTLIPRLDIVRGELNQVFDRVASLLSDGRKYLCGDSLTAADIAFASLAYPIVSPKELSSMVPKIEEFPQDFANAVNTYRSHMAGQYLLKLYENHRFGQGIHPKPSGNRVLTLKTANRDFVFIPIATFITISSLFIFFFF